MIFKYVPGIINRHGNDGAACFSGNLKTPFVELHKGMIHPVSGSFGEDADRSAGFHILNSGQNRFQPLFYVVSIQKKAVKIPHPVSQKRPSEHFFFGDISREAGNTRVGDYNVKIASVVSDIKNRRILWDIFFAPYVKANPGEKQDHPKSPLYNDKRAFILEGHIIFSDEPFGDQNGNTQNQK